MRKFLAVHGLRFAMVSALLLVFTSAVATAIAWMLLTPIWFLDPAEDETVIVDAIVLFAGGAGERLDTALHALDSGRASRLITNPGVNPWLADGPVRKLCAHAEHVQFEVDCTIVVGDTTGDEAREFSRIAKEKGVKSVLVVTSSVHLTRAEAWMRRCFAGEVFGTAAPISPTSDQILHEWGGMFKFWFSNWSCR